MDLKNIETQLALQCAPLLTGIKVSNLLIVPLSNEKMVRGLLRKQDFLLSPFKYREKDHVSSVPQKTAGGFSGRSGSQGST